MRLTLGWLTILHNGLSEPATTTAPGCGDKRFYARRYAGIDRFMDDVMKIETTCPYHPEPSPLHLFRDGDFICDRCGWRSDAATQIMASEGVSFREATKRQDE
jgi:hypothetical protein